MDGRNTPNFSDWHSIVYGHHMKNGIMFTGSVLSFAFPVVLKNQEEAIDGRLMMQKGRKYKKILDHAAMGIGITLIGTLLISTGICVLMIHMVWSITDKIIHWCEKDCNCFQCIRFAQELRLRYESQTYFGLMVTICSL